MGIKSFARSSVAMISVRAVQDAAFKNCCLRSGRYDGAKRNHFFPRVIARSAFAVRKHFCGPKNLGYHSKMTTPRSPTCPQFQKQSASKVGDAYDKGGHHGY
jgi:hypothetical protein